VNAPDDQHATQWFFPDLRADKLEREIDILGLLILDPFLQVAGHEDDLVLEPSDVADVGLEDGLPQVAAERIDDQAFAVLDTGEK